MAATTNTSARQGRNPHCTIGDHGFPQAYTITMPGAADLTMPSGTIGQTADAAIAAFDLSDDNPGTPVTLASAYPCGCTITVTTKTSRRGATVDYRRIEALHPELKGLVPYSAEWYRAWRAAHLAMFPGCDKATRLNLDMFVEDAERAERA
jgi:hypothetical protein